MKESKYSQDSRLVFRETFSSLDDISREGGTNNNGVTCVGGIGYFNASLSQYLTYTKPQLVNPNGTWSIRVIYTPRGNLGNDYHALAHYNIGARSAGILVERTTGKIGAYFGNGTADRALFTSAGQIVEGQKIEIVVTHAANADTVVVYKNGTSVSVGATVNYNNAAQTAYSLFIGKANAAGAYYTRGEFELVEYYNVVLSATEVSELYKNDLYKEPVLSNESLDINPALGYFNDKYSHTLTNTAVSLFNSGSTLVGDYNGTTSNLSFTDSNDLSPSGSFSISTWIKARNVDKFRIVSKQNEFLLTLTAAFKPYFALYSGGETTRVDVTGASILSNGLWYNIVVTYSGNSLSTGIKIYVNGVQESPTNGSSGTYAYSATNNALKIGYRVNDTTYANGLIGRTRIFFGKELTQTEITRIYNSQKPLYR